MESPINRSVGAGVQSGRLSPLRTASQSRQGCQCGPIWVAKNVDPKPGVHLPGVQYAIIHMEQMYFIAYLRKYLCLAQDSIKIPNQQLFTHKALIYSTS